jgi:hypothetical protein
MALGPRSHWHNDRPKPPSLYMADALKKRDETVADWPLRVELTRS